MKKLNSNLPISKSFLTLFFLILLPFLTHNLMAQDADINKAAKERQANEDKGRKLLAKEYPKGMKVLADRTTFGGPGSSMIANRMQDRSPELVTEARSKMEITNYSKVAGRGLWHIRFPFVNVTLVETPKGLVLLDSGYAAIGQVLVDLIPTLSNKPLLAIAISHSHVDHAYGAYALLERWPNAEVITTDAYPEEVSADIELRGSLAKYNNQALDNQTDNSSDPAQPTRTFHDKLDTIIGGEKFLFVHAPGETQGHMWVWLPERKAVATGDFYQGFLPNTGNGKRRQRYTKEWVGALREMISLKPEYLLGMHANAVTGKDEVASALGITADALEYVRDYTIERLNLGWRKDQIAARIEWPERFAEHPLLKLHYNRPADIARMVAMRYTGWWDDIPSHFAPLEFDAEAAEVLKLAGGVEHLEKRGRELLKTDPVLASRLADWAYYGAPNNPQAKRFFIDVYMQRVAAEDTPLQEATVYLSAAAQARAELSALHEKK